MVFYFTVGSIQTSGRNIFQGLQVSTNISLSEIINEEKKIPLSPIGALAPRSAHARPSPFQAIISTFHCFPGKKTEKIDHPGARGVPQFLFYPKSYFLCDLKPHAKLQNPL
jgi:hypothetical protein